MRIGGATESYFSSNGPGFDGSPPTQPRILSEEDENPDFQAQVTDEQPPIERIPVFSRTISTGFTPGGRIGGIIRPVDEPEEG